MTSECDIGGKAMRRSIILRCRASLRWLLRFRYVVYILACWTKLRYKFWTPYDDRLILLVPQLSTLFHKLPHALTYFTENIHFARRSQCNWISPCTVTTSFYLFDFTIGNHVFFPPLVRYADVFIGGVSSQTRYLQYNWDLTILTDSVDLDLDKVYIDAGNCKVITS